MSKTSSQKPPLSGAKLRKRLARAQGQVALVHIRRWIPQADRVEGFVVGVSKHWVLLHRLSDRIAFDGWIAVRFRDIQAVTIYPTEDCFEIAAVKARGLWPPAQAGPAPPEDIADVLAQAKAHATVIAVHREFDRPDVAW